MQKRGQARSVAYGIGLLAITALALFPFLLGDSVLPPLLTAGLCGVILTCAILVWIWRAPARGVYVLFGAAVLLQAEASPSFYTDFLGSYLPFFEDISSWTPVRLVFSIAEVFIVVALLIWVLKAIARREFHFNKGSLMLPLGLYMLMILVGEVHGIATGGNITTSLWEVRAQVYMLAAYVLTCNLVKTRSPVDILLWILVLATGFRGIEGTIIYFTQLHGTGVGGAYLFPHEQAFLFNAFLTLTIVLFLYGGPRRLKQTALFLLPFVLIADLASRRRTSIAAFFVALAALLLITFVAQPKRRKTIVWILVVLAIVFPPYYLAYQNKSGTLAEPARAVASNFHPDPRDASSNLYRVSEDADIMVTAKTSPIIGVGFGKPMLTPYPLPNISKIYVFWNILPHNSILWVWMRMGTIGFLLLWFLLGAAVVQATSLVSRLRDPALAGLAVFICLMIVQEVFFGYLDLQWTNYRNLIVIGVLFALISRLATWAKEDDESVSRSATGPSGRTRRLPAPARPSMPVKAVAIPVPAIHSRTR
ncbi:MAG: O-antigen ligase family protein [Chloroflexota bacterium]